MDFDGVIPQFRGGSQPMDVQLRPLGGELDKVFVTVLNGQC
jgi:hypothetical protein